MLYKLIKSYPISNNIASINPENIFSLLSTVFSFVGLNNIESFTAGISDDVILSFVIKVLNRTHASTI